MAVRLRGGGDNPTRPTRRVATLNPVSVVWRESAKWCEVRIRVSIPNGVELPLHDPDAILPYLTKRWPRDRRPTRRARPTPKR